MEKRVSFPRNQIHSCGGTNEIILDLIIRTLSFLTFPETGWITRIAVIGRKERKGTKNGRKEGTKNEGNERTRKE
jgi:hypothetical protein